jgi:acetyltransferase
MGRHYLDRLFRPRSVAVFGASDRPGAVGTEVYRNLLKGGFSGPVYAVNPKRKHLRGAPCYPDLEAIGHPVDLGVIATPAPTVPGIIRRCGEYGVRAVVVLSAGFAEAGPQGTALTEGMLEAARRHRVRILGPNCLGIMVPPTGLNATFNKSSGTKAALPGELALVSQSGALCTAILDWALEREVGFSAVVSLGNASEISFGDLLDYLALDPATRAILLYIEGVKRPRRFMSGLRAAARLKPVVVVKAGRHRKGVQAAVSHTGAMVGFDDVFNAALERAGAVRALTVGQLFAAAQLLSSGARAPGERLAIVTNGGGPGVLAADRAVDLGLDVTILSQETLDRLDKVLPGHWSHGNPVDILGDAPPERYREVLEAVLADPGVDGILSLLTPQAMTAPLKAARQVVQAAKETGKPVLACWMGGAHVASSRRLFARARLPHFRTPAAAVEAYAYLSHHHHNQQLLLEVPGPRGKRSEPDVEGARLIIEGALAERRTTLTTVESKAVLAAFGIPVVRAVEARSAAEALVVAESVGFPVAMKVASPDVTHKADVDGVRLGVADAAQVRRVYAELLEAVKARRPDARVTGVTVEPMARSRHGRELVVGVVRDPVFGPAIAFGAGGSAVEIVRDRAVALPPLNGFLARRLMDQTRAAKLLGPFRNQPAADVDAVAEVLIRVSEMACELPQVLEMDINPLLADEHGAVAVDARITVDPHARQAGRYDHMAIHPYPADLVSHFQLADGTDVTVRPIRPEDAGIEQTFVRGLSAESKYFRFMHALAELTPEMLVRFTQIDYDREMALLAVAGPEGNETEIAVARYTTNPDGETCEFALVVADAWHHQGIGSRLMLRLIEIAGRRGLSTMEGEVLADNTRMLGLVRELGFSVRPSEEDPEIRVVSRPL